MFVMLEFCECKRTSARTSNSAGKKALGMGVLNELALNFGVYLGKLTDAKADSKENFLKNNIEDLKELTK